MIDMRQTAEARRAKGSRSANATTVNHDIVDLVAARGQVTEKEFLEAIQGDPSVVLEHLDLLSRLGFLSMPGATSDRHSYKLTKLGEWAHSTSYFYVQ